MGHGRGNYRMAIIAMLFGTGELILASKMNGDQQIAMFAMVFLSYLVAFVYYRIHIVEQYKYIANKELYR